MVAARSGALPIAMWNPCSSSAWARYRFTAQPPRLGRGLGGEPVSGPGAARTGVPHGNGQGPGTGGHHPHDSISTSWLSPEGRKIASSSAGYLSPPEDNLWKT